MSLTLRKSVMMDGSAVKRPLLRPAADKAASEQARPSAASPSANICCTASGQKSAAPHQGRECSSTPAILRRPQPLDACMA
jgi:hypothetical protein